MRDRVRLENYTVRVDYFDKHEVDSFPKTREGFNAAIKLAIGTGFDVVHHKIMDDFKDGGDGVVWENPDSPRGIAFRATPGFEFLTKEETEELNTVCDEWQEEAIKVQDNAWLFRKSVRQ